MLFNALVHGLLQLDLLLTPTLPMFILIEDVRSATSGLFQIMMTTAYVTASVNARRLGLIGASRA